MLFHYTALNPANKKLSGVIEADGQTSAETKLNDLGYSIVDLKLLSGALPDSPGMIRFSFTALDKKSRKIKGTIESASLEEAYQKLIDEYELEVESLFPSSAAPEEKEKALQKLSVLKTTKEKGIKKEKTIQEQQASERKELLQMVDKTVDTVQNFLKQYEGDMKSEERDSIRSYLNQLARIKDSTNLDHIRKTSEKMLEHIREKEMFLQEKKKEQPEMEMKVEAKTLLFDIQHTGIKRDIDLLAFADRLVEMQGFLGRIAVPLGNFILHFYGAQNPEIRTLYRDLKKNRKKLFELIKLAFFSKSEAIRQEGKNELHHLAAERKRIKFQIQALRTQQKLTGKDATIGMPTISTFSLFFGWLLAFYLLFYFLTFPLSFYEIGVKALPGGFHFYAMPFLKAILIFLFLTHLTLGLKKMFLPKHFLSTLLIIPSSIILYLLFLFNFVVS